MYLMLYLVNMNNLNIWRKGNMVLWETGQYTM